MNELRSADPLWAALRTWQQESAWITAAVWVNMGLLVLALAGTLLDPRQVLGINVWIKPLKFDLSVIIFLITAAVLMRLLAPAWQGRRAWIGVAIGVAMLVENTVIALQSARGIRSHMNYGTPLDAGLFAVMGIFILINTLAMIWLFGLWCVGTAAIPPALLWAVRLGLLAFVAGSLEGVLMVRNGGHTVGARDGGPGLPLLNWSTAHGDLRVAHFFALHALQAMLLISWAVARARWPERAQVGVISAAYAGYMGAVWVLFRQALAQVPILR